MNQREKLIELIIECTRGVSRNLAKLIADHLISNGVVVLPCRCGGCEFERTCKAVNQYLGRDGYCCRARRKGGDE